MLRTAFLTITLLIAQIAFGQTVGNMTYRSYQAKNGNPRFGALEFLPKDYTQNGPYKHPLIIYLHGLGDWGNGTMDPDPDPNNPTGVIIGKLTLGGIPQLIRLGATMQFDVHGRKGSFVVLAPQVNNSVAVDPSDPGPWQPFYMRYLIDSAKRHLNIDPNKIFIVGHSYGGFGAYVFAGQSQSNANEIAGVIPVCGGDPRGAYTNLVQYYANANVAVLGIHATDDKVVPEGGTQATINSINSLNPLIKAQRITQGVFSGGHEIYRMSADTNTFYAYDTTNRFMYPNIYQWMLGIDKSRIAGGAVLGNTPPIINLGLGGADSTFLVRPNRFDYTLDATGSVDNSDVIVKYQWDLLTAPPGTTNGDFRRLKDFFEAYTIPTLSPKLSFLFTKLGTYTFRLTLTDLYGSAVTANKSITLSKGGVVNMPPLVETVFNELPNTRILDTKRDTVQLKDGETSYFIQGNNWFDWESYNPLNTSTFSTMQVDWTVLSKPFGANVTVPVLSEQGPIDGLTVDGEYVLELRFAEKANTSIIGKDTLVIWKGKALPANLRSFTGRSAGTVNELKWSTASEFNVSHFELERSADGRDFQRIARINALAGNSSGMRSYQYRDELAPVGKSYYRLRINDFDGSFKKSGVVLLNNDRRAMAVGAFPNPVKEILSIHVEGPQVGLFQIQIRHSSGALIYQGVWHKTQARQIFEHNASKWARGQYIVDLQSESGDRKTFQVIKD